MSWRGDWDLDDVAWGADDREFEERMAREGDYLSSWAKTTIAIAHAKLKGCPKAPEIGIAPADNAAAYRNLNNTPTVTESPDREAEREKETELFKNMFESPF